MEVAFFWVALAAVLIAGGWYKSRADAQKHQTFRTIVEKTGTVDEAQLKLLLSPPSVVMRHIAPNDTRGDAYRWLRGIGATVMFIAVGILFFSGVVLGMLVPGAGEASRNGPAIGMGMSGLIFLFGAGLFFSSRFAEKPASQSERSGVGSERE